MNPTTLNLVLQLALVGVVPIVGFFIRHSIKTPNDAQRALQIAAIAEGMVATILSLNPNMPYRTLVQQAVDELVKAARMPTESRQVIERAVRAAAVKAGVSPA